MRIDCSKTSSARPRPDRLNFMPKHKPNRSREESLRCGVSQLRDWFASKGVTVPADVCVSCGFPSGGAAHKRLGECWPRARSDYKRNEVFVNAIASDGTMVLSILAHELLHAADDCESKHSTQFTAMSKLIGFSGGKHSAPQSAEAKAAMAEIAASLGLYPAAHHE